MATSISTKNELRGGQFLSGTVQTGAVTIAMMNYGTHTVPFTQKFVRRSRFVPQSRYDPYGILCSQKMFKFEYLLEPPSQMRLEVTHKEDAPVLYARKYNYFMSFSMEELYDIAAAMPEILQKMEQCRDVVQGRSQYAPRSKKDMMQTLKASRRTRELEKEEVQMMYRPQTVPKHSKTQPNEDPDEDDIEEEEEEEEIEPVVHARSSRNSRRK